MSLTTITLFSLLVSFYATVPYCRREDGIKTVNDSGAGCMTSLSYGVTNCCFTCLVQGPDYNAKCGSLYNFGSSICPLDSLAIRAACGGTGYLCLCTSGSDLSQLMGTSPTDSPSTINSTASPTNDAKSNNNNGLELMTFIGMTIGIALFIF